MKILTTPQIRAADAYTIENEPISSLDLMERASAAFCNFFVNKFDATSDVTLFCGMGNNGGDGLAIARLLKQKGYTITVYVVKQKEKGSAGFEANKRRLEGSAPVVEIAAPDDIPSLAENTIIIDAIFGSGLSRPVAGLYANVIDNINESSNITVAVDVPSGLFSDKVSIGKSIIHADFTVSFQLPKLAFLMPENEAFVGELAVVDIGLHREFLEEERTSYYYYDENMAVSHIRKRRKFSHKGDFGKALIVSGSWGKIGATVLFASAALRSGLGLATIHAPRCGYEILQATVPEAMVIADVQKKKISKVSDVDKFDTIGVGPGMGTAELTITCMGNLLKAAKKPMVLDADALNILSKNKKLLKHLPKDSILTPHPKEFERLAGKFKDSFERLGLQKKFCREHHCILVLKGAHTTTCTPEGDTFFNSTGNAGMATGGMGDALTGIVTSLLAQKYAPLQAALLGVYIHGLAGDIASEKLGQEALLPSDLIDNLSNAFKKLHTAG